MLTGRHFLKELDFTPDELHHLLSLAKTLKQEKQQGCETPRLQGKNIVLLFQKDSTRTRCAFEVAAFDQGANVTYIGPSGSHMGSKESVADTARVLSRMYDAIEFRGHAHEIIETLAQYSSVPVWNGLTDEWHPTQILADFLTIIEIRGDLSDCKVAYFGDARNNMAHSYLIMSAKMGIECHIAAPKSLWPNPAVIHEAQIIAEQTGGKIILTEDAKQAAQGADVLTTDVWVSMGEDKRVWDERIPLLMPFQINTTLMQQAAPNALFLHCLPAFHDQQTSVARDIVAHYGVGKNGLEVTNDVFEGSQSQVFQQAENRLHTIKAVMVATLS